MTKTKALARALKVSMQVKGPLSILISLLGFPAAILPVLIANRLRILTDELQFLTVYGGAVANAVTIFGGIVGLYIAHVIIKNLQHAISGKYGLDEQKTMRYIKHSILKTKCEVRYKYIENYDGFHKRISFAQEHAGWIMVRSIGSIITLLQLLVALIAASIALWGVSPLVVLVLYVTSVPAAVLAYFQQDETFRGRAKWNEEGNLAFHYYHIIAGPFWMNGVQEVRHFALFNYLKARWRTFADDYLSKKNEVTVKHVKYNAAADFFRSAVYLGILLLTAWQIYQNPAVGLGAFTLVFALSGQLQGITGEMFVGVMVLMQSIPYMQEFFYLENLERESNEKTDITEGDITFDDVVFAYPNTDVSVLKGVNVSIKDGEKVAIVGENGSGKSTFISLLCGMFEPKSGDIKIGGTTPIAARDAISVVFQDFAQYEATLRENITVSDQARFNNNLDKHQGCFKSAKNATDDEIMDLLRKINVNDVVEEQPNGLDEIIGSFSDNTNNLSGGQWQKISIARAAYRQNAKIMILDEPTSALDPLAEAELYRNFATLTHDKTTILISHRLGITALVDRILVFKDGQIIEDGSHKELMSRAGHYAEMYRAQAKWYQ